VDDGLEEPQVLQHHQVVGVRESRTLFVFIFMKCYLGSVDTVLYISSWFKRLLVYKIHAHSANLINVNSDCFPK
jgi:hypothetical protein